MAGMASSNNPILFAGLTEASLPSQDNRSRYAVNVAGYVTTLFRDSFLEGRTNVVKLPRFSKAQSWQLRITGWAFARFLGGLSNLNGGKLVLSEPNRSYLANVLDARFPGLQGLIPQNEASILNHSALDSEALRLLERIAEECNLKFSSGFESRIERLTWVTASGAASFQGLEKAILRYSEFIPIEFGTAGLLGPLQ